MTFKGGKSHINSLFLQCDEFCNKGVWGHGKTGVGLSREQLPVGKERRGGEGLREGAAWVVSLTFSFFKNKERAEASMAKC